MNDHPTGTMVALLPVTSDWCQMELPHLTVVYSGKVEELNPTLQNEMVKEALTLSRLFDPLTLDVLGPDTFPDDDGNVDVLCLTSSPELLVMRRAVERWNKSQYTTFKPHVTVGPEGSAKGELPNRIVFDRIAVYWGSTGYILKLRRRSNGY